MWVCKKCNFENDEGNEQCQNCYNDRVYPSEIYKRLTETFVLSALAIPTITLFILYESVIILSVGFLLYMCIAAHFMDNTKPEYDGVISIVTSILITVMYGFVFNYYRIYLNPTTVTIISSIIAFLSIAAFIIYAVYVEEEKANILEKIQEEQRIEREKLRPLYEQRKRDEIEKYGHPTRTISGCGSNGVYSPNIRIFKKSSIIEIGGRKHKFEDILNYGVHEDVTVDLHMSKPSMRARGIVGGLLYGRAGALVGVLTAKQYAETSVVYTIYIRVRRGTQEQIRTQSIHYLNELCAELDYIIYQV